MQNEDGTAHFRLFADIIHRHDRCARTSATVYADAVYGQLRSYLHVWYGAAALGRTARLAQSEEALRQKMEARDARLQQNAAAMLSRTRATAGGQPAL